MHMCVHERILKVREGSISQQEWENEDKEGGKKRWRRDGRGHCELFLTQEKKVLMHTQSLQDYYVEVGTDHL